MGYVVPQRPIAPTPRFLRIHLAQSLPEYTVPGAIVVLEALPLTRNGKLDPKALPTPEFLTRTIYRAPRTPEEKILSGLFAKTLGVAQVSIEDNFFELGAAAASAQCSWWPKRAKPGCSSPRETSSRVRTLKRSASVASMVQPSDAVPGTDSGGVADCRLARSCIGFWGAEVRLSASVSQSCCRFRPGSKRSSSLGFSKSCWITMMLCAYGWCGFQIAQSGVWEVAPPGTIMASACVRRVEVSGLDEGGRLGCMAQQAQAAPARLEPEAGMMLQAVWFDAGPEQAGRLLLTIHHLAVDGVSWRILVPDLAAAFEAIVAGRLPELEPCGTSFRHWAQRLYAAAREPGRLEELSYWKKTLSEPDPLLSDQALEPTQEFEAQVERSPQATALVLEDTELTYAELNTQANRLAHHLIGLGIGPEDLVAVALPRSMEMAIALLGILKAGAAYLPLDPDYPAERLAYMLRDGQPACVLTSVRVAEGLLEGVSELLLLDRPETAGALAQSRD